MTQRLERYDGIAAGNRQSDDRRNHFLSYENRMVFILSSGGGIAALDLMAIFFLMPFISTELHLTNREIGTLSLAVLLGWAISSLAIGLLSDKMGRRKPFLVGAFLLFAALSGLTALATSFSLLFAARMLMGLAEGPVIPISQAIALAESSPHRLGLNLGLVQAFGGQLVGSLLGPLIVVQMAIAFGWRAAFLIAGFPGLIIALLIARFVREPRVANQHLNPLNTLSTDTGKPRFKVIDLFRYRNVQVCAVICIAAAAWNFLMITFLPLWLVQEKGLTTSAMSVVMSAVGLGGVVASALVPWLSDKFGRVRTMLLATASGAICPIGALVFGAHVIPLAVCSFAGCMMIAVFPLCSIIPLETVPPRQAATVTAVILALATVVGGGAGPFLGGILADRYGLQATLWSSLVLVGLGTLACLAVQETAPREGLSNLAEQINTGPL